MSDQIACTLFEGLDSGPCVVCGHTRDEHLGSARVEAMRAAVQRDADRVYTKDELLEAAIAFGHCQTCGAARVGKMTEPEPDHFLMSGACSADESHDAW